MHQPYSNGDPRAIIRQLREKRGFASDRALAIAAGINQPTLARYMNGTSETMELKQFQALADVLEVTVSELTGEVPLSSGGRLKEIIKLMEQLPEPQQATLVTVGKALVTESAKRKDQ